MGVYPQIKFVPTDTGYREEYSEPGLIRRRELTAGQWTEERSNCFCCSCRGTEDVSCRNHGYWGRRPCEEHEMPGQRDGDGVVPESTQAWRAKRGI